MSGKSEKAMSLKHDSRPVTLRAMSPTSSIGFKDTSRDDKLGLSVHMVDSKDIKVKPDSVRSAFRKSNTSTSSKSIYLDTNNKNFSVMLSFGYSHKFKEYQKGHSSMKSTIKKQQPNKAYVSNHDVNKVEFRNSNSAKQSKVKSSKYYISPKSKRTLSINDHLFSKKLEGRFTSNN